jgi:hypothetical protein
MLREIIIGLSLLMGAEIVAALVATLIYDPEAIRHGWETISWETLELGLDHPAYAALIGGIVGFLVGALWSHLWLFQVVHVNR